MPFKHPAQVLLHFGDYHLDQAGQRLWQGSTPIDLRPKAWQALLHLVHKAGELVTGDELLDLLWPQAAVAPKTLANLIGELRRALGDDLAAPRVIQTVHRRGYRLMVPVHSGSVAPGAAPAAPTPDGPGLPGPAAPGMGLNAPSASRPLVGRALELAAMARLLGQAFQGQRQVLLLAGDPGMGKTALTDAFVAQLAPAGVRLGRGQCVEQAGEREAFGPVLGLLAHLISPSGGAAGPEAVAQLRRCAPSWLLQLPWLLAEAGVADAHKLRSSLSGGGPGRMVREFCALMEALSQQAPLVLVLEDLHWADSATVDLLAALAQGLSPARLLVLASHQPAEAERRKHPLVASARRLQAQGRLQRLDLPALDAAAVHAWLDQRFQSPGLTRQLAPLALRHSGGNPLFLSAALDHLVERGWVLPHPKPQQTPHHTPSQAPPQPPHTPHAASVDDAAPTWHLAVDLHRLDLDLPEHLRAMVAARFEGLDAPTLQLLQAASTIGMEFNVQLLQAASGQPALALETACHALARQQMFLRALPASNWPDGSTGSAYGFVHDVYRRVLYDSLPLPVQQQMHRRVAERLEQGWGQRAPEVAGALASAYARAAQPEAAARVLEMAAVVSYQRFAADEAAAALEASLQQLALLPDTDARARTETRLYLTLGPVMLAAHGMAHPRALQAYQAAEARARRTGAKREQLRGMLGACLVHAMVGNPETGRQMAREFVPLAETHQPSLAAVANTYAGLVALGTGHLLEAQQHLVRALQLVPEPGIPMFMDLHSIAHTQLGRTLCHGGRLSDGLAQLRRAIDRCRASGATNDLVQALYWTADTQRLLGLNAEAAALFDEALPLAAQHGMVTFVTPSRIGRLLVSPGPVDPATLQALLQQYSASGDRWADAPYQALLAQAHAASGNRAAGLAAVAAGQAALATGPLFAAELMRVQADLLADHAPDEAVETAYQQALNTARTQQAHWQALRCAVALARFWAARQQAGRGQDLVAGALAQIHTLPGSAEALAVQALAAATRSS